MRYAKRTGIVVAMLASVAGWMLPGQARAADWSDAFLGYRTGTTYREPDNKKDITKDIYSFTYVSGYKYGTNFFTADMLQSDKNDPAAGGGGGAQETYVVYRTTFSFSSVASKPVAFGFVRDVGLTAGFNWSAKDDLFSSRVWEQVIGPKLSFAVPGFWDLALVYRQEENHNFFATSASSNGGSTYGQGFCSGTCNPDVHFASTYELETAWGIPFAVGIPTVFKGFLNYTGAKGKDGTGNQTQPETLLETAWMFDIGAPMGRAGAWYIGPGYQYWNNKFGNDSSKDKTGGSTANVVEADLEVHF
jgi:hypothetical protein